MFGEYFMMKMDGEQTLWRQRALGKSNFHVLRRGECNTEIGEETEEMSPCADPGELLTKSRVERMGLSSQHRPTGVLTLGTVYDGSL